ncbi:MAG: TlpA family protein disulfide reductase [Gammaproteobacteria bacterium]|nr:TlpA family protein disulfide reductase [Gammaproteobacteria bacterium]
MKRRVAALALGLAGAVSASGSPPPEGVIHAGARAAPGLALPDLDGATYRLEETPGHWVMVHFWASWCGPCRRELPAIQRMAQAVSDTSLELVLVNTAEDTDTVFAFLAAVAPRLDTLLDRDGLVTERWQPRGLPASFLVDPEGRIRYQALGGRPWDSKPYLRFLRALDDAARREPAQSSGARQPPSRRSITPAAARATSSRHGRAITCTPTGRPSAVAAARTTAAGQPVRL